MTQINNGDPTTSLLSLLGTIFGCLSCGIALIGLPLMVVALYVSNKQRKEAWEIAKQSGSLDKANLALSFLGLPLGYGFPDNNVWYFVCPGEPNDQYFFEISLTVSNTGDAACDDILLQIRVDKFCFNTQVLNNSVVKTIPDLTNPSVEWSVDEINNHALLAFSISSLGPHTVAAIKIPFRITPAFAIPVDISLSTDPSIKHKLELPSVDVSVLFPITFHLSSRNSHPQTFEIQVGGILSKTVDEAIKTFVTKTTSPESKNGFWPRRLFTKIVESFTHKYDHRATNFVSFSNVEITQLTEHKVFVLSVGDQLTRLVFLNAANFSGYLNGSSSISNQLVSYVDLVKVPRGEVKFRKPLGNAMWKG